MWKDLTNDSTSGVGTDNGNGAGVAGIGRSGLYPADTVARGVVMSAQVQ